ncbi:hypothetical protein SAMN04488591_0202 [Microbacterium azadirachtae]|uniref:Uncharacterized protein n=1 Tax=Microbacterium azadirachtae TaxID=582680 RepID=A0A1I6FRC6_9MICO|nr:hypothetical protein [Microbacterium azadirachtae]SFR32512.1 hypothetical protein SAMN04488591_0202 [Microbacterium azadirachtae]
MSTSDQHGHVADRSAGNGQLTRKQLREARLTGSTPIVTEEEAEAARLRSAANAQPAAEAVEAVPEVDAVEPEGEPEVVEDVEEPLTRRQIREQERIRTGSLPVTDGSTPFELPEPEALPEPVAPLVPEVVPERPAPPVPSATPASVTESAPQAAPAQEGMITDVPRPAYPSRRRSYAPAAPLTPEPARSLDEQDGVDDAEQGVAPVSASAVMRAEEETGRTWHATTAPEDSGVAAPAAQPETPAAAPETEQPAAWSALVAESESVRATPSGADDDRAPSAGSGSSLNPAFGQRVLTEEPKAPAIDSFDTLIGDSTGSHHAAPNALIFQQAPTAPSLSGPVASTGEILVTGSYELPAGLGSRGHADGVADGKEVDAILVDGELAPASSPTPIAASAAIGTIKPAGEVIRPPEPEKGNKLMLALTITAGALAVALVGALIVAITTGAFS